jgi:fatty acid desaturase
VRWVNELVGWVAGIPQLTPFLAFRYVHLEHHKHTNEPGNDPDFWAGSGPRWQWPLRWLTTDLHYYPWCLMRARKLPREVWAMTGVMALYWGGVVGLALNGHAREVLLLWLLPTRLATALLGFAFDFLPHRPHTVPARENRFVASYVVEHAFLTPLLLGQNYHLIHHLYPAVPFYRYGRVWRALRERLVASGARVLRLW